MTEEVVSAPKDLVFDLLRNTLLHCTPQLLMFLEILGNSLSLLVYIESRLPLLPLWARRILEERVERRVNNMELRVEACRVNNLLAAAILRLEEYVAVLVSLRARFGRRDGDSVA